MFAVRRVLLPLCLALLLASYVAGCAPAKPSVTDLTGEFSGLTSVSGVRDGVTVYGPFELDLTIAIDQASSGAITGLTIFTFEDIPGQPQYSSFESQNSNDTVTLDLYLGVCLEVYPIELTGTVNASGDISVAAATMVDLCDGMLDSLTIAAFELER